MSSDPETTRNSVLWVTKYTGWDYQTIMQMPMHELNQWREAALEFHEERLKEQADIAGEAHQQMQDQQGSSNRPLDSRDPTTFY